MTPLVFVLVLLSISIGAGFLGALVGLGGGIIVIPALTLGMGVDIRYAIGASIVSVMPPRYNRKLWTGQLKKAAFMGLNLVA